MIYCSIFCFCCIELKKRYPDARDYIPYPCKERAVKIVSGRRTKLREASRPTDKRNSRVSQSIITIKNQRKGQAERGGETADETGFVISNTKRTKHQLR